MESQKFLNAFGHIANAPGGVDRIREVIFELAARGELISGDDALEAVLLGSKADFIMGQAPPGLACNKSGTGTPFVKTGEFGSLYPEIKEWTTRPLKMAQSGDVLICVVGATIGKLNLGIDCAIGRSVAAIRSKGELETKYLYYCLMPFVIRLRIASRGSAQGVIGKSELSSIQLRCPSMAEQALIVAKVDELMALCDQLEKQQEARRALQIKARKALIQTVASKSASGEVLAGWGKLTDHFADLFSSPEDVEDLRGLILDLAVRGELVPQSIDDQRALDWFEQLNENDGASKGDKRSFAGGFVKDPPFPLPDGWAFFHLGAITLKIGSGSTPRGGREVYVKNGVTFLRSQNIWNDGLRLQDVVCILPEVHKKMAGSAVRPKDILLNITGASLGRCTLVPDQAVDMNVSQHVTIIRPMDERIRQYLHLCILSPYVQSMVWGRQVGMAREGLSKKVLEQFEIPVPPIAEQLRIVARVDELMRLCAKMEAQLRQARTTAESLAQAAVSSITGIAVTEEEAELKAPQTELIAPLRIGKPPEGPAQAPLASILVRHSGALSAKDLWQRFGGEIDGFYAQLKHEVAKGWIVEPEVAEMRERESA